MTSHMQMRDEVEDCRARSVDLLRRSAGEAGWMASPDLEHYAGVWTRDAALTALGPLSAPKVRPEFIEATRKTLQTLAEHQGRQGQIPAVIWPKLGYWDWADVGATDASSLFVLLGCRYLEIASDGGALVTSLLPAMLRAVRWLRAQDANDMGLIDSPQASDWMDSTLNRSGKVLYNNVLFYAAVEALSRIPGAHQGELLATAGEVKLKGNLLFWPDVTVEYSSLWSHVKDRATGVKFPHPVTPRAYQAACRDDRSFYISHMEYGRFIDRCDVLANVLAILVGFADEQRAQLIINHLTSGESVRPYPARSWERPFMPQDSGMCVHKQDTERFQDERWRNPPYQYHNAAVWPFIGGYLVAAAFRVGSSMKQRLTAQRLLEKLAEANRLSLNGSWGFHEWIDSRTGVPQGASSQAWNAGSFLLAYDSMIA